MRCYRCDACGRKADYVHVLPLLSVAAAVRFSCPDHTWDGYGFPIENWFAGTMRRQLETTKRHGPDVIPLIEEALELGRGVGAWDREAVRL